MIDKIEEIQATFAKENLRFAGEELDTIIGTASNHAERFTIKGPVDGHELQRDQRFSFYGRWAKYTNKRTGKTERQFHFKTFVPLKPIGRAGVIAYLIKAGQGRRIGPVTAAKIWESYGEDSVEVVRTSPETISEEFRVRIDYCESVAAWMKTNAKKEQITIRLVELLDGRGFPQTLPSLALKKWGNKSVDVIKKNPFVLMEFRGVGFLTCDSLYLSLGLRPNRLRRQAYAAWYSITSDTTGNTWFHSKQIIKAIRSLIGSGSRPAAALKLAKRIGEMDGYQKGGLVFRREENGAIVDSGGELFVAGKKPAENESVISKRVSIANLRDCDPWPDVDEIRNITDHQKQALRDSLRGEVSILGGSPGTGKAQPVDSMILTENKWLPMGEVKIGDNVFGRDGRLKRVNGVFDQGVLDVYKVSFSDGTSTECCEDHLWFTRSNKERQRKSKSGSVKPLKEIMNTLDRGDGGLNHSIPMVEPIQHECGANLIDPYLLGVLLGDGCLRQNQIKITNSDSQIINECKKRIPAGCKFSKQKNKENEWSIVGNQFLKKSLKKLGVMNCLSVEKFIPESYLFSDVCSRVELLQGLLDTDGYTDGHHIEYSTSSEKLKDGVVSIVQSIGGICSVSTRNNPSYTYKKEKRFGKKNYRVTVKLPSNISPFKLERKLKKYIPKTKYPPKRFITKVEKLGKKNCRCISIDCKEMLYITDSYIVTHNTYASALLIKKIADQIGIEKIAVAAPTGKAAVRISEAMAEHGVAITAKTWHSLLGVGSTGNNGGDWKFNRNENNPFEQSVIIGDESSMIDTDLMSSIFRAKSNATKLLFVGDVNQLPPVGHGAPLRDMIAAGVPYGELLEIMRNSGGIVETCAAIRDGNEWSADDNLEVKDYPEQIGSIFSELARAQIEEFDPVWDCQILVAVNDKSPLSRKRLNRILQDKLNPPKKNENPNSYFRPRDKIVCLKNGRHKISEQHKTEQEHSETYVANGELAEVVEVLATSILIKITSSGHEISIATGKQSTESSGCDFDLAYALSVHKSQGSEWPVALVVIDDYQGAKWVCDRSWLYTAISRAKKRCVLIGQKSTADAMCRKQTINNRKTYLRELILKTTIEIELAGI